MNITRLNGPEIACIIAGLILILSALAMPVEPSTGRAVNGTASACME